MRFIPILLCFMCSYTSIHAEYGNLKFSSLTIEDGLSSNWVNAISRDHTGYIWMATKEGLNRYDGQRIVSYVHDSMDSTSISGNYITSIYTDKDNNVWVGTLNTGLCIYNRDQDNFIRLSNIVDKETNNKLQNIRSIYQHGNGEIWIGTHKQGVVIYDFENNSSKFAYSKDHINAKGIGIKGISEDAQGDVWIASYDDTLRVCNPMGRLKKKISLSHFYDANLANIDKILMFDSDSVLWIGTRGRGVYTFDIKHNAIRKINGLSNPIVKDMIQIQDRIFIATDNGGLNVMDKDGGRLISYQSNLYDEFSLTSNGLYDLCLDKEGILWIASFDGGVNYYNPKNHQFKHYYPIPNKWGSLPHQNITSVTQGGTGRIYVATDGGGLSVFDPLKKEFSFLDYGTRRDPINDLHPISVYEDGENLYVGSFQKGVSKVNLKTKEVHNFKKKGQYVTPISSNSIVQILKDKMGCVWFLGSQGGLNRYNPKTGNVKFYARNKNEDNSIFIPIAKVMYLDRSGNFMCGGHNGYVSLFNYEKESFKAYNVSGHKDLSKKFAIQSICQGKDDIYWIGTQGGGLRRFNVKTGEVKIYQITDGLPINNVLDILCNHKNIWISTENGLSSFDIENEEFHRYNTNDGLQSRQFSINAALKANDGSFYFGGVNGLNVFKPQDIKKDEFGGKLIFSDLKVLNKSVEIGDNSLLSRDISRSKEITLSHNDYVFSIEFLLINYTNADKVSYSYTMEGFDKDWIHTDNSGRMVTYTNLPGGEYTFRVKAFNQDGVECEKPIELRVKIIPPVYEQEWFISLCVLIVLFLIYGIYWYRMRFLKNLNANLEQEVKNRTIKIHHQNKELERHRNHLEEIVKERTLDLVSAKEKAEESDRLKSSFLANMSHEIRTPMNAIVGFCTILNSEDTLTLEEKTKYLQIISDNSETLMRLIDDIIDISKIEAGQMDMYDKNFNLSEFLKELHDEYSELMIQKLNGNVKLNIEIPSNDIDIRADQTRVRQVIINLLNNAVKFTYDGSISIRLEKHSDEIKVLVKDTGIGIPSDQHEMIFKRFIKIEGDKQDILYGGTGLGLFISKRIVEYYNGEIGVESSPNNGSTFWFSLPN